MWCLEVGKIFSCEYFFLSSAAVFDLGFRWRQIGLLGLRIGAELRGKFLSSPFIFKIFSWMLVSLYLCNCLVVLRLRDDWRFVFWVQWDFGESGVSLSLFSWMLHFLFLCIYPVLRLLRFLNFNWFPVVVAKIAGILLFLLDPEKQIKTSFEISHI